MAVAAIAGGTFAFKALDKSVKLVVDGKTQSVSTYASNVEGVLKDANVKVVKRDDLTPKLTAAVADGGTIVLNRARPLAIDIDGVHSKKWVTAYTVEEALSQLGIDGGADVSASRSQRLPLKGASLEVTTPKTVAINVDGQAISVVSTGATVKDVLDAQSISLVEGDFTTPAVDTPVTSGMQVDVTRVRTTTTQEAQPVPYSTSEQPDGTMNKGDKKVVTKGVAGEQVVTYTVTTTNGVVSAKTQVSAQVTVAPVNEVVNVGTKEAPVAAAPAPSGSGAGSSGGGSNAGAIPSSGGLNWPALAQCESSGNPKAVSPAGYMGLYQFDQRTWNANGGSGSPLDASAAQQTAIAQNLYNARGISPWPSCGPKLLS
ncbi:uncharacterized protein YabE (DUF348 family) [Antricoccus suffuscus]|uniref:Uncharacterized protein YabE (DUF348 family) n=1 Tax=Antricoccus suffuscus TaxID=1629062 RepID=A0A2T0ZZY5_9ACTN|nr:resuscitation-promoting factor [Antricoccus suffuscus]PRZ41921.1 uncharacterized protein YabE (DUF348 family) [Antricoccus suffuscus]